MSNTKRYIYIINIITFFKRGITMLLEYMMRKNLKGREFAKIDPELGDLRSLGLYVHIPFCKSLCPYCPYTREVFRKEKEGKYVKAVKEELDLYSSRLEDPKIESFYFGGGTPSIMVDGLIEMIDHAKERFDIKSDVAIEANPDDLNETSLSKLWDRGVRKLSIGVQSFDDSTLRRIGRLSHDAKMAEEAILLAKEMGFKDLNIDLMFNLPGQSLSDLEKDLNEALELKPGQITTYPLILFPYTRMYGKEKADGKREKRMYDLILDLFNDSDYEQINAWSFAERGIDKYGSVERSDYIGVGAGAMSMLPFQTYSNTFFSDEYEKSVARGKLPIAFGSSFDKRDAEIQWFMLRLYDLKLSKEEFKERFEEGMDGLRPIIGGMKFLGVLKEDRNIIEVKKPFTVHSLTKIFLQTFISRLQGEGFKEPWPKDFSI
jgi:oxygen-independent coproporphyrinogen-3 oxidase